MHELSDRERAWAATMHGHASAPAVRVAHRAVPPHLGPRPLVEFLHADRTVAALELWKGKQWYWPTRGKLESGDVVVGAGPAPERGARVVIASRSREELEHVASSIGTGNTLAVPTDVSDEKQVLALFEKAQSRFGGVDLLVNNAGTISVAPISELTLDQWDAMIDVNLRGTFLCSREMFRRAKAGERKSIVNISSLAGIRGVEKFPGMSAYAAAKHGVIGLTEILALEGREKNIRVNAVAPGAVDTKMLRDAAPFLKTSTKPEDVAKTILFLLDESQAAKVNGAVVEIYSNE